MINCEWKWIVFSTWQEYKLWIYIRWILLSWKHLNPPRQPEHAEDLFLLISSKPVFETAYRAGPNQTDEHEMTFFNTFLVNVFFSATGIFWQVWSKSIKLSGRRGKRRSFQTPKNELRNDSFSNHDLDDLSISMRHSLTRILAWMMPRLSRSAEDLLQA